MRNVYISPEELLFILRSAASEANARAVKETKYLPARIFYKSRAKTFNKYIDYLEQKLASVGDDTDIAYRRALSLAVIKRQEVIEEANKNPSVTYQGEESGLDDVINHLRFARNGDVPE